MIVEVQRRHVANLICVMIVGILICVHALPQIVQVICWNDVQVIVGCVGMSGFVHFVDSLVTV